MKIGALKESQDGEARVAITPSSTAHLKKLGHEVHIETGAGARSDSRMPITRRRG